MNNFDKTTIWEWPDSLTDPTAHSVSAANSCIVLICSSKETVTYAYFLMSASKIHVLHNVRCIKLTLFCECKLPYPFRSWTSISAGRPRASGLSSSAGCSPTLALQGAKVVGVPCTFRWGPSPPCGACTFSGVVRSTERSGPRVRIASCPRKEMTLCWLRSHRSSIPANNWMVRIRTLLPPRIIFFVCRLYWFKDDIYVHIAIITIIIRVSNTYLLS